MNQTRLEFRLTSDSPPWSEAWGIDLYFDEWFVLTDHQLRLAAPPSASREICVFSFDVDGLHFRTLDPSRTARVNGRITTEVLCRVGDRIRIDASHEIEILRAPDREERTSIFVDRKPVRIDVLENHDGNTNPGVTIPPKPACVPTFPPMIQAKSGGSAIRAPILVKPGDPSRTDATYFRPRPELEPAPPAREPPRAPARPPSRPTVGPIPEFARSERVELESDAISDDFTRTAVRPRRPTLERRTRTPERHPTSRRTLVVPILLALALALLVYRALR